MEKLTERQREVLAKIWGFVRTHGKFPTYRELMKTLHVGSKQTIADYFSILGRKGYIAREKNITLTEKALQYLIDEEVRDLKVNFFPRFDFFPVQYKGVDTAGSPFATQENYTYVTYVEESSKGKGIEIKQPQVTSPSATITEAAGRAALNPQRSNLRTYSVGNLPEATMELIDSTKNEINIVFVQNTNSVYIGGRTERKSTTLKLVLKIRSILEASVDKLFGLLK